MIYVDQNNLTLIHRKHQKYKQRTKAKIILTTEKLEAPDTTTFTKLTKGVQIKSLEKKKRERDPFLTHGNMQLLLDYPKREILLTARTGGKS